MSGDAAKAGRLIEQAVIHGRRTTGPSTPWPWQVRRDSTGEWLSVHNDRAEVVCILRSWQTDDARLIAATPELLAALRGLMAAEWRPQTGPLQYDSVREDAWAAADAAIAKAEGREP